MYFILSSLFQTCLIEVGEAPHCCSRVRSSAPTQRWRVSKSAAPNPTPPTSLMYVSWFILGCNPLVCIIEINTYVIETNTASSLFRSKQGRTKLNPSDDPHQVPFIKTSCCTQTHIRALSVFPHPYLIHLLMYNSLITQSGARRPRRALKRKTKKKKHPFVFGRLI